MTYMPSSENFGPTIPGRFVNRPEDISPSEIPMNGSLCLFPSADYHKIYARQRAQNGNIMEVTFVPERPPQIPQAQPVETVQTEEKSNDLGLAKSIESINKRLNRIEKRIQGNRYHKKINGEENKNE